MDQAGFVAPEKLRVFFRGLVFPGFSALGITDREIVVYIVDMLARFARTDQLYRIRDARGQRLEGIAEMLIEAGRGWGDQQDYVFDRELEVRRHIGDYALFTSGLFRAWVEGRGLLDYYLEQGRAAYRGAGELAQMAMVPQAGLLGALGEGFEHLAGGLDYVRKVYMRPEAHSGSQQEILRRMGQLD